MSQTLFAILAMMLATLFSLQQHRHVMQAQINMIRTEVATQATGVATDRLEEIGAKAFDEQTKGGTTLTAATSLTGPANFILDTPGDDIDDFHNTQVTRYRTGDADTLSFQVETSISYVNSTNLYQESVTPTKFKKATVRVWSLNLALPDTITLAQTYACGSACDW